MAVHLWRLFRQIHLELVENIYHHNRAKLIKDSVLHHVFCSIPVPF